MEPSRCNGCNGLLLTTPTSPYKHFLRREEIPPPLTAIKARLMQQKFTLNQLDEEILRLQRAREAVHTSISDMESLLSPVRTLPVEILSNILERDVASGITYVDGTMPEISATPPGFVAVCKWWRDVALATPMLWRFIAITTETPADYICNLLDWSGQVPLTLTVEDGVDISALLPVIAQAHRWESASFGQVNDEMRLALNQAAGQFRMLKEFGVEGFSGLPTVAFGALQGASQLETLVLCGTPSPTLVPWSQLTTINLYYVPVEECLPILESCPRLAKCYLSSIHGGFSSLPLTSSVTLANLRQIEIIRSAGESDIHSLLLALVLPALQCLVLAGFDSDFSSSVHSIVSYFHQISSLSLRDCVLTSSDVVELLKMLPSLRNLVLEELHYTRLERVMGPLVGSPDSQSLVPLLSSIAIRSMYYVPTEEFVLTLDTMVRSRWRPRGLVKAVIPSPPSHLSSVILRLGKLPPNSHLLQGLREEGLDIRLYLNNVQVL